MKITKTQLKQIIKEELEVTLTNEEAGDMFGEAVEEQLEEQELNELEVTDPSVALVVAAMAKMAYNFSPAVFGTIAIMAARKAMGLEDPKEVEKIVKQTAAEVQKGPPPGTVIPMGKDINRDNLDEEANVAGDVARAGEKLGKASGIEAALANINTRPEFEQMMMKFIQMVSATKLKPQDVKTGVRNVAKQILQAK
jgi:hypothetical protein